MKDTPKALKAAKAIHESDETHQAIHTIERFAEENAAALSPGWCGHEIDELKEAQGKVEFLAEVILLSLVDDGCGLTSESEDDFGFDASDLVARLLSQVERLIAHGGRPGNWQGRCPLPCNHKLTPSAAKESEQG
ncbi:MAG: hypothetical protein GY838_05935 [bacterium]|nr:hypothetical protein [bacterium]